jgi:transposase InsO family protein
MKYGFIESERSEFSVERMCQAFKVSRSGFYGWKRQNDHGKRKKEDQKLLEVIKESYKESRGTYGSPRMTIDVQEKGLPCGENRVARLMKKNNIAAKTRKKFKATTQSKHHFPVAPNLLNRNFSASAPNQVWLSDLTYVWTEEGWLYLAVVLDVFNRQIVGWGMGDRLTADLVLRAFHQAVGMRHPAPGLIFHSDRGVQYACSEFRKVLQENKMIQSMSGKGNCYDNAMMESFFHTLKIELIYFRKYLTRLVAKGEIFEYIGVFYNRIRRHSSLGYRSPHAFEQQYLS